jgi:phytoene dehydrogenase-like protein/NAD-dependent dihydropyrimidine dehydrogenase PreA subunit
MKINQESCTGCGYCLLICPSRAIVSDGWARVIDEVCTDCNLCFHACPNNCFTPDVPLKLPPARYADRYDVIVIGAGLGGLMAAAWLAREGREVAVFEKLSFIGGRYTEINHRGYAVTTGAWSPMGPKSNIGRFLADVGAQVEYITLEDKGLTEVSRFRFRDGREFGSFLEMLSPQGKRAFLRALVEGRRDAPRDVSAQAYLERYVQNEDLLAAVDALVVTASGLHADAVPASEYMRIILDTRAVGQDFGFPVGGVGVLVKALARVIKDHGGAIFTQAEVARVRMEGGVARGVALANGDELEAGTVIHNAGAHRLLRLVGRENLPAAYVERIEGLVPVECGALILGTREPLFSGAPMLLIPGCQRVAGIFAPTWFEPGIAPPGHQMYDVFFPLASDNRRAELALALEDLRALFPRFDAVLDLAVPMFFTAAWPGTETGQTFGQVGEERLAPRTPIEGLYLVGMDVQGSGAAGDLIPVGVRRLLACLEARGD